MLVYFALGDAKFWCRGHCPTLTPAAKYFASQWNIGFRDFLLSTGEKELIEATGDSYWAYGATFFSKKVQDNKTTGKNKLGKLWAKQRTEEDPKPTCAYQNNILKHRVERSWG